MISSLPATATRSFLLLGALAGLDVGRQPHLQLQRPWCGLPGVGAVAVASSGATAVGGGGVDDVPVHDGSVDAVSTGGAMAVSEVTNGGGRGSPFIGGGRGGRVGGGGRTASDLPWGSVKVRWGMCDVFW